MIETTITYFGKQVTATCDGNCRKAWGINSRPCLANGEPRPDDDLPDAPIDPKTYEGIEMCGKPLYPHHNKWCYRECERMNLEDSE